jgi:hypothetical protein
VRAEVGHNHTVNFHRSSVSWRGVLSQFALAFMIASGEAELVLFALGPVCVRVSRRLRRRERLPRRGEAVLKFFATRVEGEPDRIDSSGSGVGSRAAHSLDDISGAGDRFF